MPGSLTEYALRLSLDRTELDRFRTSDASARAAMTAAGLSEAEMRLLLAGDQRRICDALAADASVVHVVSEAMEIRPEEMPTEPMEMPPSEPMEMPPAEALTLVRG